MRHMTENPSPATPSNNAEYTPCTAAEVTEEMVLLALDIADGFFTDRRIDWDDLLYRLDGAELHDGRRLCMPDQMTDPAIVALQRRVNAYRRAGG